MLSTAEFTLTSVEICSKIPGIKNAAPLLSNENTRESGDEMSKYPVNFTSCFILALKSYISNVAAWNVVTGTATIDQMLHWLYNVGCSIIIIIIQICIIFDARQV